MTTPLLQTATRLLGKTEANWVAVVDTGTGITISSILFNRCIPTPHIEGSVRDVLARNPRLRSVITCQAEKQLFFETPEDVAHVNILVIPYSPVQKQDGAAEEAEESEVWAEPWHSITEEELNTPFPTEYPFPVFQPKLYLLPDSNCLLILRVHSAAADIASTATVVEQIVSFLHRRLPSTDAASVKTGTELEILSKRLEDATDLEEELHLPSIEAGVPPGEGKKPFWAHGVDMMGYGFGSRRHSYLPFQDTGSPRTSKLLRKALSPEATTLLLKECEERGVSLCGAINAAGLKAVATIKQVGAKGEHYGTAMLLQCRHRLQPTLPDSAIGFYHSAMLRTTHSSESAPFWDLASKCGKDFEEAIEKKKHFTDMGDLNALMAQAMRFPNLTPSGSLRTAALSMTFDPVPENVDPAAAKAVGVQDYMSCSSTHGVGPCLGIFSFMRQSSLQFSFVYPSPLLSRSQMQQLVDHILSYLSTESHNHPDNKISLGN